MTLKAVVNLSCLARLSYWLSSGVPEGYDFYVVVNYMVNYLVVVACHYTAIA